jgi:hypothetical protein
MRNRTFFVAGEFWDTGGVVKDLPEFTKAWMKLRGFFPRDRRAFSGAMRGGGSTNTRIRAYQTNFHITNVPRFLGMPGFLDFMMMVDLSGGIFGHRWGDAPLIYLAMAMFGRRDELMWKPWSWSYGHGHRDTFRALAAVMGFFRGLWGSGESRT